MGQPICIGCGYDRVRGVNINDTPPKPPLTKRLLTTPKGFLLTSISAAIVLAVLTDGQRPLVWAYAITTGVVVVVAAFVYWMHYLGEMSPVWNFLYPDAHDLYVANKLFGRDGPWLMQCLVVLALVMVVVSAILFATLPPDFGPQPPPEVSVA